MPDGQVQLLLIEPQAVYRTGLCQILENAPDLKVIAAVGDGMEALQRIENEDLLPDIVITTPQIAFQGVAGTDKDNPEFIRLLKRKLSHPYVIVSAPRKDVDELLKALRLGVSAYVERDVDPSDLLAIVRSVAQGNYLINEDVLTNPGLAQRLLQQFNDPRRESNGWSEQVYVPLSKREIEILDQVKQGNSNKRIAQALGISDQTVKNHITSILRKLAVNDRTEAVVHALQQGWLKLDNS